MFKQLIEISIIIFILKFLFIQNVHPFEPLFEARLEYGVGLSPRDFTSIDINKDGYNDLIVVNNESNSISVKFNEGDGTFYSSADYTIGENPTSLVTIDLDHDLDIDLAVLNEGSKSVTVLMNNGNGYFDSLSNYNIGGNPKSLVTADFNYDGYNDLAYIDKDSTILIVFLNNESGYFYTSDTISITLPTFSNYKSTKLIAKDVNGDDTTDFIIAYTNSYPPFDGILGIYFTSATLNLSSPSVIYYSAGIISSIYSDDFDNDNLDDIVVIGNGDYNTFASIHWGDENFEFDDATNLAIDGETSLRSISGGKLDNDNFRDIVFAGWNGIHVLKNDQDRSFSRETINIPGVTSILVSNFKENQTNDIGYLVGFSGLVGVLENNGNGIFYNPLKLSAGYRPYSATSDDFNNDGYNDIAICNFDSDDVSIYFNDGYGVFDSSYRYNAGDRPITIFASDINNDGDIDLVLPHYYKDSISILFNDGYGGFDSLDNYYSTDGPKSVITLDIDNDNDEDLIIGCYDSDNIDVRINNGHGYFESPRYFAVGDRPTDIYRMNVDNDNYIDVAVANYWGESVSILRNNQARGFTVIAEIDVNSMCYSVAAGDLNNDGYDDIVATVGGGIAISYNLKNNSFSEPEIIYTRSGPWNLQIADAENDGDMDVFIANVSSSSFSLLLNTGNGTFEEFVNYGSSGMNYDLYVSDLDNDSFLDVILPDGTFNHNSLSIVYNSTTIATNIEDNYPNLPNDYLLSQNYPNPFNPNTMINYSIPVKSNVKITIYNILGQNVRTILNEVKTAGNHTVIWNGKDENGNFVSSGLYFYRLTTDNFNDSKKMILLK